MLRPNITASLVAPHTRWFHSMGRAHRHAKLSRNGKSTSRVVAVPSPKAIIPQKLVEKIEERPAHFEGELKFSFVSSL